MKDGEVKMRRKSFFFLARRVYRSDTAWCLREGTIIAWVKAGGMVGVFIIFKWINRRGLEPIRRKMNVKCSGAFLLRKISMEKLLSACIKCISLSGNLRVKMWDTRWKNLDLSRCSRWIGGYKVHKIFILSEFVERIKYAILVDGGRIFHHLDILAVHRSLIKKVW